MSTVRDVPVDRIAARRIAGRPNLPSEGPAMVEILDLGDAKPGAEIREIAG